MDFWTDPLVLAAGNARGMQGGDPDTLPNSPTAGAVTGSSGLKPITDPARMLAVGPIGAAQMEFDRLASITDADLSGDLTATALRLNVDPAYLVRLRKATVAPPARGVFRRLFRKADQSSWRTQTP